jgi:Holliday junction resolvasome RuvABC endonuclease subunit
MLTVLGIDPGLAACGAAILRWPAWPSLSYERRPIVVHTHTIYTRPSEPLAERFRALCVALRALGSRSIDLVACEEQSGAYAGARKRGQTNDDALYVREVVGALRMLSTELGVPFYSITPLETRTAVGLGASASKQELRERLERILDAKLSSLHVSDAAAVAVAAKRQHQLALAAAR